MIQWEPEFRAFARGRTSVRYCEKWILSEDSSFRIRCKEPAYFITDPAIVRTEGYYCEEHILSKAVDIERERLKYGR